MPLERDHPVVGVCRLCGERKKLTFEHVPPAAAFNTLPRFYPNTTELIAHELQGGPTPSVTHEPRGAGAYTLCGECNNRCSRYAIHFVEWSAQWAEALKADASTDEVTITHVTRRARVMKQIAAMFLSANPPETGRRNEDLRRYVWNAQARGLPPNIRVFAALTRDESARQAGVTGYVNLDNPSTNSTFSEIAFTPLVLVMTFNAPAPDARLVELTFLAQSRYSDQEATTLALPVVKLPSYLPGMYT